MGKWKKKYSYSSLGENILFHFRGLQNLKQSLCGSQIVLQNWSAGQWLSLRHAIFVEYAETKIVASLTQ